MYYRVLVASQRYHGNESLTYSSVQELAVGQIIKVSLGKIQVVGVVESATQKPKFAVKEIVKAWDIVVPPTTIKMISWLQTYYPAPLGSITELFMPPALPQKLASTDPTTVTNVPKADDLPPLTDGQKAAVQKIQQNNKQSVLLHGDTGTGKTRLYIELALAQINSGKSVIITTPEIGLTRPLVNAFGRVFGDQVFVTHSGMTPASRRAQWLAVCRSSQPVVLIGPRSALFFPVNNLGLVIIDEAHDTAYKQDQSPYYQATRMAAALAATSKAQLVLGTATPLVADYYTFEQKQLPIVRLTQPAIESTTRLKQVVVDAKDRANFARSPYLSNILLDNITKALENSEQSLLFLNRRGSARVVMCQICAWRALCPHCDTALTYHADSYNMRCHSCDHRGRVPTKCPECSNSEIVFKSIGTKALEAELQNYFPSARIARFDRDTHQSQGLNALSQELHDGTVDIIIGTQAIAKGFDLPKLAVVGVVQADMSLSIPDFSASERTYQLLSQVSGRVGRGHRDSSLIIQTHTPESPVIKQALSKDYSSFYQSEISERKSYSFPPFVHLMTVTCSRASSKSAESACQKAKDTLLASVTGIIIDGPTPRFIEKTSGKYSWHLVVRAKSRTKILEAIKALPSGCIPNPDPTDLL